QDAEVGAERFAHAHDVRSRHLQLLPRLVVEFVGKEAVNAAHVANGRDQDVQENRCERTACRHDGVTLENFFVVKIHLVRTESIRGKGKRNHKKHKRRKKGFLSCASCASCGSCP